MLKMSREVDLGLLLMVELAGLNQEEVLGLRIWAEERGLPYRFLSKIAVKLKKAGLLKSKEGREGGYRLGKLAKKISVGEVMRVLEGPMAVVPCLEGRKCEAEDFCRQKVLMGKLSKVVRGQLDKVSLKDLC
jgi:Rrf2 family protein